MFDLELLTHPYEFRKEVIVHDLLHLKAPIHGKLFKALLKAHLGRDSISDNPIPKLLDE